MAMRFASKCAIVTVWLSIGTCLSGCALVDWTLSPRTYDVNESSDQVLNNTILLNIVRSKYYEPLNFVAIARYTAMGQVSLNSNLATVVYSPQAALHRAALGATDGPNNAMAQAQNSFDLSVLDTKDFYTGLLRTVDAGNLDLWFRQGLPRGLVFYALLDAIRVTSPDGVTYEFRNDPADDRWTDPNSRQWESPSLECDALSVRPPGAGSAYDQLFAPNSVWVGIHERDCYVQKFAYFIRLAFKYGLTVESLTVDNPKWTKSSTTEPKTITKGQVCFDAALANENRVPANDVPNARCGGSKAFKTNQAFSFASGAQIRKLELVFRSPFKVFRYLGQFLVADTADRIRLSPQEAQGFGSDTDDHVLTVVNGSWSGCFAEATFRGARYCVPNVGAENTKQLFTLLRVLLAINISPNDLNPTPTVRVTP